MIRIDMNLDVYGLGVKVTSLAQVTIANDGTGTSSRGNYNVVAISKTGRVIRKARVENWARKSKPPLALLRAALEALGY